jgi:hypothetical protein
MAGTPPQTIENHIRQAIAYVEDGIECPTVLRTLNNEEDRLVRQAFVDNPDTSYVLGKATMFGMGLFVFRANGSLWVTEYSQSDPEANAQMKISPL